MNWKGKCKKTFLKNKQYFGCDTLEEWLNSEDFFECFWYYLSEEVKNRAEIEIKKKLIEDEMKQKHRKGILSPIEVMVGQACGILDNERKGE